MENKTTEQKLGCIMEHYSEAQEELMGAQAYAKKAYHAEDAETRSKYNQMARQELAHAAELKQMSARAAQGDPMLTMMWDKLQEPLDGWQERILEKIKHAEHKAM